MKPKIILWIKAGLIREAAGSLKTQFGSKKQKVKLSVDKGLPPVQGNPDRLIQVLTNLLSNAHKYTPEGGRITITTTAEGDSLRIEVKDTGIGMTADEQKGLFTKFYRADNEETRTVPGTGLGLWITRSIVEMHGGEIKIESRKGQGTQVSFSLPVINHE